mmetsp:Transcript_1983/g.7647  ORF Transcript_1983/g.7647 Transcript_1983/m.7647 type:complete len:398 (+) Transcript_1983:141-1334(+)
MNTTRRLLCLLVGRRRGNDDLALLLLGRRLVLLVRRAGDLRRLLLLFLLRGRHRRRRPLRRSSHRRRSGRRGLRRERRRGRWTSRSCGRRRLERVGSASWRCLLRRLGMVLLRRRRLGRSVGSRRRRRRTATLIGLTRGGGVLALRAERVQVEALARGVALDDRDARDGFEDVDEDRRVGIRQVDFERFGRERGDALDRVVFGEVDVVAPFQLDRKGRDFRGERRRIQQGLRRGDGLVDRREANCVERREARDAARRVGSRSDARTHSSRVDAAVPEREIQEPRRLEVVRRDALRRLRRGDEVVRRERHSNPRKLRGVQFLDGVREQFGRLVEGLQLVEAAVDARTQHPRPAAELVDRGHLLRPDVPLDVTTRMWRRRRRWGAEIRRRLRRPDDGQH